LTFLEVDRVELTVDLRFNDDRGIRLAISNDVYFDRDSLLSNRGNCHRHREIHVGLSRVSGDTVLGTG
jgi:hypothetical protein